MDPVDLDEIVAWYCDSVVSVSQVRWQVTIRIHAVALVLDVRASPRMGTTLRVCQKSSLGERTCVVEPINELSRCAGFQC